ncbi:MAG: hypothetical protein HRU15_03965, partial [Planctomycetes bacterium]|nr:hypothetical protein [Planctomycetota bacterium]
MCGANISYCCSALGGCSGRTITFEIVDSEVWPTVVYRQGRVTQIEEANGDTITIAYEFARDATDA